MVEDHHAVVLQDPAECAANLAVCVCDGDGDEELPFNNFNTYVQSWVEAMGNLEVVFDYSPSSR